MSAMERYESCGFERIGLNLWRRPARTLPGYVKTKDPRDFDGCVAECFAELTDNRDPITGELQPRFWFRQ